MPPSRTDERPDSATAQGRSRAFVDEALVTSAAPNTWIAALQVGQNPFDTATLAALRGS